MFGGIHFKIALRYLKSKGGFARVVSWFSFVGIALGVATLIVVTSVMNGFRAELLDKIVGMKGHIEVTTFGDIGIKEYGKLVEKIRKKESSIIQIFPLIEKQSMIIAGNNIRGCLVQGMKREDLQQKQLIKSNVILGDFNNFAENSIFIGSRLAQYLGVHLGDNVRLIISDGFNSPFGTLPQEEEFRISGIFEVGMAEYDKTFVFMPLNTAQEVFNMPGKVSKFEIFVRDVDKVDKITHEVSNLLEGKFNVLDWQHVDASIFHAVVVEKNVMTLILSIIVLVAVFNIISCLTMLAQNKVRDIAILRTLGMTKHGILKIFVMVGGAIGTLGVGVGSALGLFVAINIEKLRKFGEKLINSDLFNEEIYFLSQLPSRMDPCEVVMIAGVSLLFCFLSTIYPSLKAARSEPVDALKF